MEIHECGIRSEDLAGVGVLGLADTPDLSALEMQTKFEETARRVIIPKFNALLEALAEAACSAQLGAADPVTGENVTVQKALESMMKATVHTVVQELTAEQRQTARDNIRALSWETDALEPGQQVQARANIGAASTMDTYALEQNKAPKEHISQTPMYGKGSGMAYGHVLIKDTPDETLDVSKGAAVTPKALYNAMQSRVSVEAQELTEEQQTQVRANIGALSRDEIVELIESMTKQDPVLHMDAALLNAGGAYPADSNHYTTAVIPAEAEYVSLEVFDNLPNINTVIVNGNCEFETYAYYNSGTKVTSYQNAMVNSGRLIRKIEVYGRTEIEKDFARDLTTLKEVVIGAGVKTIGASAFYQAGMLNAVTMAEVETIGDSAFAKCAALESIDLPASVTDLGYSAFQYCENLKSCVIHDGVTKINGYLFGGCTRLESLTIPASVESINVTAFTSVPTTCVIRGYAGSYAQSTMTNLGYTFEVIG